MLNLLYYWFIYVCFHWSFHLSPRFWAECSDQWPTITKNEVEPFWGLDSLILNHLGLGCPVSNTPKSFFKTTPSYIGANTQCLQPIEILQLSVVDDSNWVLKGLRREVSACKSMLKWQPLPKRQWNFSPLTHQKFHAVPALCHTLLRNRKWELRGTIFVWEKKGKKRKHSHIYMEFKKCANKVNQLVHVDGISRTDKCMLLFGVKRHILSCFTHLIHLENTGTARYDMNIITACGSISTSNPTSIYNIIQQWYNYRFSHLMNIHGKYGSEPMSITTNETSHVTMCLW